MHFTLKFLGEIELTESAAVCQAIARATAGHAPFELQVQGAGAFPSADRPRTLWLGVSQGAQALESLQGSIDAEMAKLGYRPEPRRFQGHLTIGRVKEGRVPPQLATVLAQWRDFDAGEMAVHDVRLYSSVLRPEGPLYEVMGRARLDAKNQAG
jgi:2'-5' RNA ligase